MMGRTQYIFAIALGLTAAGGHPASCRLALLHIFRRRSGLSCRSRGVPFHLKKKINTAIYILTRMILSDMALAATRSAAVQNNDFDPTEAQRHTTIT